MTKTHDDKRKLRSEIYLKCIGCRVAIFTNKNHDTQFMPAPCSVTMAALGKAGPGSVRPLESARLIEQYTKRKFKALAQRQYPGRTGSHSLEKKICTISKVFIWYYVPRS